MLFRVLDIETVPDLRFFSPGEPKWTLQPGPAHEFVVPGVTFLRLDPYRAQKGNAMFELGDSAMRPVSSCDIVYRKETPFPPPQAHKVFSVAWCDVSLNIDAPKRYSLVGLCRRAGWKDAADEKKMLMDVRDAMTEFPATLVTWNGRTFDLPVLAARALYHGVPWGWYYDERNIRYRYSSDGHDDLMDFMSDFGAARPMKLGDAARLVGLPGKTDMDGSKVEEVVSHGPNLDNEEKISWYCLQDAVQTALFFVRTRFHLEIVDAEGYAASIATFAEDPVVRELIDVDWDKLGRI